VERDKKAILKREFRFADSEAGSSWEYKTFNYLSTVSPTEFTINKPGVKVLEPLDRLRAAVSRLQFGTYRIQGDTPFKLYDASVLEVKETKFLRSSYSDGVRVVSLFQVRGEIDKSKLNRREDFTVHVWKKDDYSFALVGSLTAQELERLARLVRR
jgi:hypothetical protein